MDSVLSISALWGSLLSKDAFLETFESIHKQISDLHIKFAQFDEGQWDSYISFANQISVILQNCPEPYFEVIQAKGSVDEILESLRINELLEEEDANPNIKRAKDFAKILLTVVFRKSKHLPVKSDVRNEILGATVFVDTYVTRSYLDFFRFVSRQSMYDEVKRDPWIKTKNVSAGGAYFFPLKGINLRPADLDTFLRSNLSSMISNFINSSMAWQDDLLFFKYLYKLRRVIPWTDAEDSRQIFGTITTYTLYSCPAVSTQILKLINYWSTIVPEGKFIEFFHPKISRFSRLVITQIQKNPENKDVLLSLMGYAMETFALTRSRKRYSISRIRTLAEELDPEMFLRYYKFAGKLIKLSIGASRPHPIEKLTRFVLYPVQPDVFKRFRDNGMLDFVISSIQYVRTFYSTLTEHHQSSIDHFIEYYLGDDTFRTENEILYAIIPILREQKIILKPDIFREMLGRMTEKTRKYAGLVIKYLWELTKTYSHSNSLIVGEFFDILVRNFERHSLYSRSKYLRVFIDLLMNIRSEIISDPAVTTMCLELIKKYWDHVGTRLLPLVLYFLERDPGLEKKIYSLGLVNKVINLCYTHADDREILLNCMTIISRIRDPEILPQILDYGGIAIYTRNLEGSDEAIKQLTLRVIETMLLSDKIPVTNPLWTGLEKSLVGCFSKRPLNDDGRVSNLISITLSRVLNEFSKAGDLVLVDYDDYLSNSLNSLNPSNRNARPPAELLDAYILINKLPAGPNPKILFAWEKIVETFSYDRSLGDRIFRIYKAYPLEEWKGTFWQFSKRFLSLYDVSTRTAVRALSRTLKEKKYDINIIYVLKDDVSAPVTELLLEIIDIRGHFRDHEFIRSTLTKHPANEKIQLLCVNIVLKNFWDTEQLVPLMLIIVTNILNLIKERRVKNSGSENRLVQTCSEALRNVSRNSKVKKDELERMYYMILRLDLNLDTNSVILLLGSVQTFFDSIKVDGDGERESHHFGTKFMLAVFKFLEKCIYLEPRIVVDAVEIYMNLFRLAPFDFSDEMSFGLVETLVFRLEFEKISDSEITLSVLRLVRLIFEMRLNRVTSAASVENVDEVRERFLHRLLFKTNFRGILLTQLKEVRQFSPRLALVIREILTLFSLLDTECTRVLAGLDHTPVDPAFSVFVSSTYRHREQIKEYTRKSRQDFEVVVRKSGLFKKGFWISPEDGTVLSRKHEVDLFLKCVEILVHFHTLFPLIQEATSLMCWIIDEYLVRVEEVPDDTLQVMLKFLTYDLRYSRINSLIRLDRHRKTLASISKQKTGSESVGLWKFCAWKELEFQISRIEYTQSAETETLD